MPDPKPTATPRPFSATEGCLLRLDEDHATPGGSMATKAARYELARAVNNHDRLVAALERADWIIRQIVGNRDDPGSYEVDWSAIDNKELKAIRAVLAAAKGE